VKKIRHLFFKKENSKRGKTEKELSPIKKRGKEEEKKTPSVCAYKKIC
jgi:hypothetical protein